MNKRIKQTSQMMKLVSESLYPNEFVSKNRGKSTRNKEKVRHFEELSKSELIEEIVGLEKVFNFHRSVIQHLNTGLITLDQDGIITFSNQSAAALMGYSIDQLLNKEIKQFIVFNEKSNALEELPSHDLEIEMKHATGELIPIRANFDPYTDEGNNHSGIILGFQDMSEIFQLKKQMERMDRLATLGEVSAGIAHEIRNPLAGAKSIAQVLADNFEENESISDFTSRIVREIDRANVLLQSFFKFAKPARPKKALHDTEAFIEHSLRILNPQIKHYDIQLKTDFSQYAPHFYADQSQIEQVFTNVILNGIDAIKIKERPEITVRTSKTMKKSFKTGKQEAFTIIEISDNGGGIEEDHKERIFNPFFSTKQEGVGLGLSISSRLMEENDGELDFMNNKLGGATFIMLLPTS